MGSKTQLRWGVSMVSTLWGLVAFLVFSLFLGIVFCRLVHLRLIFCLFLARVFPSWVYSRFVDLSFGVSMQWLDVGSIVSSIVL